MKFINAELLSFFFKRLVMTKICYGIDFGTSNTSLSYNMGQSINLAQLEGNSTSIPSAMFFTPPNNQALYGRHAIDQFLENEEGRFMRSLKRVLGTSLMKQGTVINGKTTSFFDIISGFIQHIKTQADEQNNQEIDHVVMGRPVFFIDDDTAANKCAEDQLREIAQSVGFKNIEFQFEPIAAAFAHEASITQEHLCLVVDIGGGTSDFTVLKLSPENHKKTDRQSDILSNTGIRIGGNDFDKKLSLNCFMPLLGYQTIYGDKKLSTPAFPFHDLSDWSKVNSVYTPKTIRMMKEIERQSQEPKKLSRFITALEEELGHTILAEVEKTKISLTQNNQRTVSLSFIDTDLKIETNSKDLDTAITENINKIKNHAEACIKNAGTKNKEINMVILTGGSTELPLLQSTIKDLCPNATIYDDDKFGSVARGLTHDALNRFR